MKKNLFKICCLLIPLFVILVISTENASADFYWEEPIRLSGSSGTYPQAFRAGDRVVAIWQENQQGSTTSGQSWISAVSYSPDGQSSKSDNFIGPIPWKGESAAPVLFSAARDSNNNIAIAAISGESSISIYLSETRGMSFRQIASLEFQESLVAPRIYPRGDSGWYLFAMKGNEGRLSIVYSLSGDGRIWTDFKPFLSEDEGFELNFLPVAGRLGALDLVVYQSTLGGNRGSYQLWAKSTADGGSSWSQPQLITDFFDSERRVRPPSASNELDNQVPHLQNIGDRLWLTWLRRLGSDNEQVFIAPFTLPGDNNGRISLELNAMEALSSPTISSAEPRIFQVDGEPALVWSENRGGGRVVVAIREGNIWRENDLTLRSASSGTFGKAVYLDGSLWSFWQSGSGKNTSIISLVPDRTVNAPVLVARDFNPGRAGRASRITVSWQAPQDSSGILGYSLLWSRDPDAEPLESVPRTQSLTSTTLEADSDGIWYLSVKAADYAGNWSRTSRIAYTRDTTPPSPPQFHLPAASPDGFLASSSFTISWDSPPEPDVDGYSWVLEYLGPLDRLPARRRGSPRDEPFGLQKEYSLLADSEYEEMLWNAKKLPEAPATIKSRQNSVDFSNIEDGYWVLALAAIDYTGNISKSSHAILRADKFIPYTAISNIRVSGDNFSGLKIDILGRGFSEDGNISIVAVDLDGQEPWDFSYTFNNSDYRVNSDRLIENLALEELPKGDWRVGVYHPVRGWVFTRPVITITETGTLKTGPLASDWIPQWKWASPAKGKIDLATLFLYLALLLPLGGLIFSFRQAAITLAEGRSIREDALAIMEGKYMSVAEREKAVKAAFKKGAGLRTKFAFTVSLLVLFVVTLVSVPLTLQLVRSQTATMAKGLQERAEVLLESAVQGARSYLPSQDDLNLSNIPYQTSAVEGALWMTISGFGKQGSTYPDTVWASNESEAGILQKLDTVGLQIGESVITDNLSPLITAISSDLNEKSVKEVGPLASYTQDLRDENVRLSVELARNFTEELDARQQEVSLQIRSNDAYIRDLLAVISDASVSSVPVFDPDNLSLETEEFIFYKPILYSQGREDVFYRGMVRLALTTEHIVNEVKKARAVLFTSIFIIAAIAMIGGIIGSFILSGIIIRPIRQLVRGIETIRDTGDKKDLASFSIDIKSKDELRTLADTINEMTSGLVEAAREADFITVGKDVQKMFIPLEANEFGEKLTTGSEVLPSHSFFGYYEGAKGVSGDYFDYRKLDDRYWAFIKCDVSGKGVPAALIMVGVATIFTTEFQNWSFAKDGIKLDELTYRINDFLFGRGFKGRFAAFLMGVYDSQTGAIYLCHAGDKFLYIYSSKEKKVIKHELVSPSGDAAPAAGPIDSEIIRWGKAPFTQVIKKLEKDDILLLFTDGFDESNRIRRLPDFSEISITKTEKAPDGTTREVKEAQVEYFGEERIIEVIEAVMSGGRFSFKKEDDPLGPDMVYEFDFSSCKGNASEIVMGIAAVEKVFRMVPRTGLSQDDLVLVDTKVDEMLERCFIQYRDFCSDIIPHPSPQRKEYKYWRRMQEDEQYDDLTMMAIKRNR